MPLATLIPIIVQYGVPAAEWIWQKIQSEIAGTPITQADWDALKLLTSQTAATQMAAAEARANIDPKSVQGQAFSALVVPISK